MWHALAYERTDSTMWAAQRRLRENPAASPFVLHAREQTAGYGRRGTTWQSEGGNLLCTFALPCPVALEDVSRLSRSASLAVAETAERLTQFSCRPTVKKPNDVLIDGAKIAGILLETFYPAENETHAPWLLIGIGLNLVPLTGASFPYPVTSLAQHGAAATPEEALAVLGPRLHHWLFLPGRCGNRALETAWQGLSV